MPPMREKSKFPAQSMTILKCFERQRDKQKITEHHQSPIGNQGSRTPTVDGSTTPKSITASRPSNLRSEAKSSTPEVHRRNVRVESSNTADYVTISSSASAVCCRKDNRQTAFADAKSKTSTPHVATPSASAFKDDVVRRSTHKLIAPVKSVRRNLTSRMNECSPIAQEADVTMRHSTTKVELILKDHDEDSEDDFMSTPTTSQESMQRRTFQVKGNTKSHCDDSDDDDFVAFRRNVSSSVGSTPISAKFKNHDEKSMTLTTPKRKYSPASKLESPRPFKKARTTNNEHENENEQSPIKSSKPAKSGVLSPFTRSIVVQYSPARETKTKSYISAISPRSNGYLNLISDRFADVRMLLRSPTQPEKLRFVGIGRHPATPSRTSSSELDLLMPSTALLASEDVGVDIDQGEDIGYYLRNFLNILKSALSFDEDYSLFDDDDMNVVRNFYHLPCKAQKLYVRLFARQNNWIPLTKMNYSEIAENLEDVLQDLKCKSFLESEENLISLKTVLTILQVAQIKELCRHLNIKAGPQKAAMVELIMNHCKKQKSVVAGLDVAQAVTIDAKKLLKGGCWRLVEEPRRIFSRIFTLYSLTDTNDKHEDRPFQLETVMRVNMGRLVYPSYEIFRRAKIFRFKNDFIRYEAAYLLDCDVASAMEKKDWETADRLCAIAVEEFTSLLCDDSITTHDAELPTFLRKFTAGNLYTVCICRRVEVLEKTRRYEEAVAQLELLLEQNIYCQRHKGHWIERIALNLDQHLDKPVEALRCIGKALSDPAVTDDHKLSLHQRAMRISKSRKLKALYKETLVLPSPVIRNPTDVHIEGKKCEMSVKGSGAFFLATEISNSSNNFHTVVCSVEKFAILHYRKQGFPEGLHGEGSTLVSLFGLLFWDIIYCDGIPDAFRCKHQNLPLDLSSDDFYSNREVKILERIDLVKSSPMEELVNRMSETWTAHFEQMSIINWTLFDSFQKVQSLVYCIGNEFLANVCLRFATNYRHYRSGVPDIVVWNWGNRSWKMIEVKGPGDKLSLKQILWLDYLLENGVSAEVCYVKAISGKEINRNEETALLRMN